MSQEEVRWQTFVSLTKAYERLEMPLPETFDDAVYRLTELVRTRGLTVHR